MTLRDRRSIVAIDPTTRGIAYVQFERGRLVDWGHRRCGSEERNVAAFVEDLLTRSAADILLLEDAATGGSMRRPRIRRLLRRLASKARQEGIAVLEVSRCDVRSRWAKDGVTRKEVMAAAIAQALPELHPFVPPRRKTWMSEHPHVNIFDAASLVLHAFPASAADLVR